jgi:sulfur-oxidizing protein SoxY
MARSRTSRRQFLAASARLAAGASIASIVASAPASATPETLRGAIAEIVGDAQLREGRVTLDLPPLVENGNAVPLTVSVESPMTAADHVKAIHVFNEKNPQPYVLTARLGPRAARARLSTRIKLADAQRVVAVAEMSDGTFWSASADIIVTIAACVEGIE